MREEGCDRHLMKGCCVGDGNRACVRKIPGYGARKEQSKERRKAESPNLKPSDAMRWVAECKRGVGHGWCFLPPGVGPLLVFGSECGSAQRASELIPVHRQSKVDRRHFYRLYGLSTFILVMCSHMENTESETMR